MYKKALSCLLIINLSFLLSFISVRGVEEMKGNAACIYEMKLDGSVLANDKSRTLGIVSTAASGQRVVDYSVLEKKFKYSLATAELEVLCRIVEAEAGCEDEEGKLLVANVVLNRVNSERFPDTVSEVVFQKEQGVTQFSPVSNGRYYCVEISEETMEAVGRALEGEDISQGALFFAARKYADNDKMRWFDENLTFLFQHGGHEFFK